MVGEWAQPYTLFGRGLGFSTLLAALPTLLLLFLLVVKRTASWFATLAGLVATLALAMGAYGMSAKHALSSAADGATFGVFPISWVVYWALVLYELTVVTGKFEVIKDSIGSVTSDKRMQALLIAFAFGAFIEGCAGFGAPVAVAAAMMVGLGYSALYATSICLLADTAPVVFGSIGIPVITLAGVTGLPLLREHGVAGLSAVAGRLTAPMSFLLPAYIILVTSGWAATVEVWPALLVSGGVFASIQFFVSNSIGPQLTDILASIAAMVSLVVLLRFWEPKHLETHDAQVDTGMKKASDALPERAHDVRSGPHYTAGQIWSAWMPYALLVVFVLAWGYPPILAKLDGMTLKIAWPGLHNEILRMPPVVTKPVKYAAMYNFSWASASGTAAMCATILSALVCGMKPSAFFGVLVSVAKKLITPTITVAAMLAMAFTMNYSGATGTLGLAFASTGRLFPFFSPILGWLGVFLTGSDTSANALFGPLQVVSANRLGFDPILIAAANSVGGVMGKMISLQSIAVAAAAAGLTVSDQAKLFRFTLKHSIFLASVVGVEVMLWAYLGHTR